MADHPSRPFQYSLTTLFVVVTGVSAAFSLVLCHTTFGLMAVMLLVGGGWSWSAVRAGHRRLAYALTACALGVIGHVVVAFALIIIFGLLDKIGLLDSSERFPEEWFTPGPVLLMSAATTFTAMVLRKAIRAPRPQARLATVIAAIYLTALLMDYGLAHLLPSQPFVSMLVFVAASSAVLATLTLPLTIPLSMFCCWVLRKVDPPRTIPSQVEASVRIEP